MADARLYEPDTIHRLKNHLAVIVSFSELLLRDLPQNDPHRADVSDIHQAGIAAIALLPDVVLPV